MRYNITVRRKSPILYSSLLGHRETQSQRKMSLISKAPNRDHPSLKDIFCRMLSEESFRKGLSFRPRPNDVIIATPPKCGTTWMQQIVHQLKTGGDMDFDTIHREVPCLEIAHDIGHDLESEQKAEPRYVCVLYLKYNKIAMSEYWYDELNRLALDRVEYISDATGVIG